MRRWIIYTLLLGLIPLWILTVRVIYLDSGLFWWLGTDFGQYYVQAQALWSDEPSNIFYPESYSQAYQNLLSEYITNRKPGPPTSVPYPPIFPFLFTPFIKPPPVIGFLLWEALNVLGAVYLGWRATRLLPKHTRATAGLVILTSFPVMYTLFVAQPQILLACALAECYLALCRGKDFVAGLWLSCLLIKPQYGLLIGLFLIWKGRWSAVAGSFLGGMFVIAVSILVAGWDSLLAYPHALSSMAVFKSPDVGDMINWRSVVLAANPSISTGSGLLLTQGLSVLTVLAVVAVTRGPYRASSKFSLHFALVVLATLLVSYHSFNYGAVMLIFPLVAVYSEGLANTWAKWSMLIGSILPTVSFTALRLGNTPFATRILTIAMLLCFGSLLWTAWNLKALRSTAATDPVNMAVNEL